MPKGDLSHGKRSYKRGRWAAKYVMLRKPHYDAVMSWAKQSGMSKAAFFRLALMRGSLELARDLGIDASFPELPD
jgi:hypothetical protein